MVAVQFGLGVWTLLSGAEIWLGVLHQTGAVLLLLAMLRVLRIATPRTESAATTYHLRTA
jgi:heme A synthase